MNRPEGIRQSRWVVAPTVPTDIQQSLAHVPPVLLQVLYNRGIGNPAEMQAFLEHRYLKSTDPFLLPDMATAVARIQQAMANDELIVVYGDFDADGVTSTVLLTQALRGLGMSRQQVRPYIPDRVDEGYGLNMEALSTIRDMGAGLVITVDCGVRSVAEVEHANAIGLDVIITDHHSLGPQLPPAVALINPKRADSAYPDTMLAGVGIAYKLAEALRLTMPEQAEYDASTFLDLVAVGTVADLAPLLHENRQLVQDGLAVLNLLDRPGLAALAEVSSLKPGTLSAESIGFGLGPRINAAGRLSHAYSAAKLLAANNNMMARELAHELNELNKTRQQLTAELGDKAEAMVDPNDWILIAADESFLPGVVGLVASRLADKNYRPAIILEKGAEESRGSCRSIPEFHITNALDAAADLLVRHGGHAQAAGFTVLNENLDAFMAQMRSLASAELEGKDLFPSISVDAELPLHQIDWALHETLQQLEPTGYGNPTPIFVSRNVDVVGHRAVGQNGAHLQVRVSDINGGGSSPAVFAGIAFRQGAWADQMPQTIDLVYSIGVNEWNGRRSLQLMVQDICPSGMLTDG